MIIPKKNKKRESFTFTLTYTILAPCFDTAEHMLMRYDDLATKELKKDLWLKKAAKITNKTIHWIDKGKNSTILKRKGKDT